jgi:hypothetical protein
MPDTYDDDRLRALLEDAVADVDPEPALQHIQSRTRPGAGTVPPPDSPRPKVTTMSSRRPWIYAAVGAVAATAATLVAVTALADDEPSKTAGPVASPTGTPSEPQASASSEPSVTASPSEAPTDAESVPVYYVADTSTGPRLFREFHQVVTSSPAKSALVEAIQDSAADPDYRSPWAGLDVAVGQVELANDTIVIDLGGEVHDRPAGMSADEAGAAVQQLVYTAQAVYQDRAPVLFLLDGKPTDSVLGVPTSEPLAEGDPMQVQGTVWITSPQDGDSVGSTIKVTGRGAFFEASVSWQLLQGGSVVKHGFATAEEGNTLSPYTFTVRNVPAGDYVLRVYDADMSGGEGNGEAEDTKQITVTG